MVVCFFFMKMYFNVCFSKLVIYFVTFKGLQTIFFKLKILISYARTLLTCICITEYT